MTRRPAKPDPAAADTAPKPPPDPLVARYLDWLATNRKLSEYTLVGYGHDLAVLQESAMRLAPGVPLLALETRHIRSFAAPRGRRGRGGPPHPPGGGGGGGV